MNIQSIRHLDALKRIATFGAAHAADFPAPSRGQQAFDLIGAAIPQLAALAAGQSSGTGAARAGTTSRSTAYAVLHDDLAVVSKTAHALAADTPGLDAKFRLPRSAGNQALLNAARAFATDATPLKDQFVALELPADFLDHITTDIQALEDAIKTQKSGKGTRAGATAGLDDTLHNALHAARTLDTIVRNKYRNDAASLAAWTVASHVERTPRAPKAAKTVTVAAGR